MTLRYLYGRDDLVAPFVARMIPNVRELGFGKCKTIGVLDENNELSSRLYMVGTGVRDDGTRVIGMVIKSR